MRTYSPYIILISSAVVLFTFISCGNKKQGNAKRKVGDTLSVLSNFDLLIEEDPDNPELYFQRAEFHLAQDNVFSGMADIEKAISLDSTKAKYYILLADFNLVMNKIPELKNNLNRALQLEPENTDALLKFAEFHLYLQDYPKVFEHVNKALRINQYLAKGYFLKGMAYIEMADTPMAVSSFQTCVEQDPEYFHAYMQLGLIFSSQNDPVCVTYFNNAIRVNPTKPESYYALGYFYQENGQYEAALQSYDNMLKVSPKNAAALYNKGYIHLVYLKNYDEAINWFTQAIRSDGRYADAYYNRGLAYELKKNKTAARQDYENALRVNPQHQLAPKGLSRIGK
jgi:tetratricopeptide (TPR) repeat protein